MILLHRIVKLLNLMAFTEYLPVFLIYVIVYFCTLCTVNLYHLLRYIKCQSISTYNRGMSAKHMQAPCVIMM